MSAAWLQAELALENAPRDGAELLGRLRALGLRDTDRLTLTSNRTVMVSFRGRELRVHRGFLGAPRHVHVAIVHLVQARTRAARNAARRAILAHPIPTELSHPRRPRRPSELSERDHLIIAKLKLHHGRLNELHFAGGLSPIEMILSSKMRRRLGHFALPTTVDPPHIAISRRHMRHAGWAGVVETLLHEMVHQWQWESGMAVDHRSSFKRKSAEVGLAPAEACR